MRPGARRRLTLAPRLQNLGGGAGGVRCVFVGASTLRAFSLGEDALLRFALLAVTTAIAMGCSTTEPVRAPESDDFGDPIVVRSTPRRIVSLNPPMVDLLFALGAGKYLVGRTHWDLSPDSARLVADLGTGIRPNVEAVLGVRPDLVILYASNDNRTAASQLRAAGVNTLSLKVDHIADFHRATRILGALIRDTLRASIVSDSVARTLERVRKATAPLERKRVFWHIWDAPLITIARGSYMNELIEIAGGSNIYGHLPDPSPSVSIEDVIKRNPDYIITGPEGAAKIKKDPRWSAMPAVKAGRIVIADTSLVGRPSVQLGQAAMALASLLHPGAVR
ncbi:MAG TPA: helical backbone metal receptor [Gemmatimonadaceae bacterium]|nr:helical backbone metal receptor [Gemmatimonadaceae bacterium]